MVISGIQQIGIGVEDLYNAWSWYRNYLGFDIRVFEEEAVAELMLPYTGGKPQNRRAVLALNLQGGGGFEIWQYTKRTPLQPKKKLLLGDLGIFAGKLKCRNAQKVYEEFSKSEIEVLGDVHTCPAGIANFFIKDPFGNIFNIVECNSWFKNENKLTGGSYGALIGVSDIEVSKSFYRNILGYDEVIYEEEGKFDEFRFIPGGDLTFKRALLRHSKPRKGHFSPLFGPSEIELVQVRDRKPNKIYEDRFWGDLGFIHLSFDVIGFSELRDLCKKHGHPFTVDSTADQNGASFDMGEAAGHFSYIEDPDGALIEFIETHKVPIVKKLGLYLNLKKKDPEKALSRWILKAFAFNRVKEVG
ncbi:MAG: VOC family protein [Cytophagales bacterium]|nr:VOC family protein [Cytophagales bacterium]